MTGTPEVRPTPSAALLLLAAGSGQRSGSEINKVLVQLGGRPVLNWSLDSTALPEITRTVLVIRETDRAAVTAALAQLPSARTVTLVVGGSTRHGSEAAGLAALASDISDGTIDVVVIHDAARPFAGSDLFRDVIAAARRWGGALPGRTLPGLIPRDAPSTDPAAHTTADAGAPTVAVQTPQAFQARALLAAYRAAENEGFIGSDTAGCVERFTDLAIACVPGAADNVKITFPEDLSVAERLLHQRRVP